MKCTRNLFVFDVIFEVFFFYLICSNVSGRLSSQIVDNFPLYDLHTETTEKKQFLDWKTGKTPLALKNHYCCHPMK